MKTIKHKVFKNRASYLFLFSISVAIILFLLMASLAFMFSPGIHEIFGYFVSKQEVLKTFVYVYVLFAFFLALSVYLI